MSTTIRNPNLGRLQKVDLRQGWISEPGDFTPWLAEEENLALLAETVGIQLELEAQEKRVGPFSADILCRHADEEGHWVLIENQLERTDHRHLGQVLTYASGLKAATIVWIAAEFTDEHRAALDWLNEITDPRFNFFGLEIELWRIGDSPPAPKFNITSEPNDWSRSIAASTGGKRTRNQELQLAFWSGFAEYVQEHSQTLTPMKPRPRSDVFCGTDVSGVRLRAVASFWSSESNSYEQNEIRAELVLRGALAKHRYEELRRNAESIERDVGGDLDWYSPDDVQRSAVRRIRTVDLSDREKWPDYYGWLATNLAKLQAVLVPRIQDSPQG